MRGFVLASTAVLLVAGAAVVFSQGSVAQKVRPGLNLSQLTRGQLIGQIRIRLPEALSAYTDVGGKSLGAGANRVVALDEGGNSTRNFPTQIGKPTIAPHGTQALLIGDLQNLKLHTLALGDGSVRQLLDLRAVAGRPGELLPYSEALKNGEFSAAASDGKNVYVAFSAGFSSSIYKIDPSTRRVLAHGWASAPDPSAMSFNDGTLFVLVGNGSQVRRFTDGLQKSKDAIDLPFTSAKGLGIRAEGEIRTLNRARTDIAKIRVPLSAVSRSTLLQRLDRRPALQIRYLPIKLVPINFAKRYAVLICGDLAENFWGECFWNDTVWMYKTLLANGYQPADILVLYGDGVDYLSANNAYRHSSTVTDFAATVGNVNMVLNGLKVGDAAKGIPKMDSNDTLFLWTFDHGGLSAGQSTLCLRDGVITASSFATKLNAVAYAQRAIFMQQCYSGGFINQLKSAKTYISTACRSDEVARPADTENETVAGKTYSHGEYNYYITTALNRLNTSPPGGAINADSNGDTYVSSKEMHAWEAARESMPETPQSNDMGGIGSLFRFKK
jgi:hypothetical protein